MRREAILLLTALLLGACGADDAQGDDAGEAMGGLVFVFTAPDVKHAVGDPAVTVDEIHLHMRDVRAVGDTPQDDRTYIARTELQLDGNDREIRFDEAPPATYSQLKLVVDRPLDGESAWSIKGSVDLQGTPTEFEVKDEQARSINLGFNLDVGAGDTGTITIEVDVISVLEVIDWSLLPPGGEIDDDSPQMPAIRARFDTAFSVAGAVVQ